jgi:hypothetical protein
VAQKKFPLMQLQLRSASFIAAISGKATTFAFIVH